MRLRSIVLSWLLVALSLTGVAHAATFAAQSPAPAQTLLSWLPPPPPPPPTCPETCLTRYRWCLADGVSPGVCAGKYNYCLISCSANPPVLGQ